MNHAPSLIPTFQKFFHQRMDDHRKHVGYLCAALSGMWNSTNFTHLANCHTFPYGSILKKRYHEKELTGSEIVPGEQMLTDLGRSHPTQWDE